jgi:BirA family transcriptional regulator, biotin operon repressor / biotin---[acetyl-CoA-carboxylase] ligase
MGPPDAISPAAGRAWPPGWTVEYVEETASTNTDLLETALARPDRSVLVAGHQTAGRGRLDRRWDAPPRANLLVSLLFHTVPPSPNELTRRLGLAAVEACRRVAGVEATLKWPNDVLVGDAKLAGILAQRHPHGPVVVGIGLNVRWAPDGAARLGPDFDPLDVLDGVLGAFDDLPVDPTDDGALTDAYRAALTTLGRPVRVHLHDRVVEGRAVDVDVEGRLIVIDACAVTHRFDAGDVIHLR